MTFIGTGLTVTGSHTGPPITTIAQNLPYGTHVFKIAWLIWAYLPCIENRGGILCICLLPVKPV